MFKFNEKIFRKIDSGKEIEKDGDRVKIDYSEKEPVDSRLNESEALIYQDYARLKELRKNFSDKAERYDEAQKIIDTLQKKGLDLNKYDLEKIDLSSVIKKEEFAEKIDKLLWEMSGAEK